MTWKISVFTSQPQPTTRRTKTLKKLEAEQPILTVGEIGGLLMAAAEAMIGASGSKCGALSTPAKSLMNCLEEEVTGAIKP